MSLSLSLSLYFVVFFLPGEESLDVCLEFLAEFFLLVLVELLLLGGFETVLELELLFLTNFSTISLICLLY